jgi:hypothetical protein
LDNVAAELAARLAWLVWWLPVERARLRRVMADAVNEESFLVEWLAPDHQLELAAWKVEKALDELATHERLAAWAAAKAGELHRRAVAAMAEG